MLKIYDKAKWHIDAGADADTVVKKMTQLFDFLDRKDLLKSEGKEMLEIGIDSSISIHERMLTEKGNRFMEDKYDSVIDADAEEFTDALEKAFAEFER
jgi:activator of 2-hydroxyglutaryl-CoA dehydratase